jgi:hypothetical protein
MHGYIPVRDVAMKIVCDVESDWLHTYQASLRVWAAHGFKRVQNSGTVGVRDQNQASVHGRDAKPERGSAQC